MRTSTVRCVQIHCVRATGEIVVVDAAVVRLDECNVMCVARSVVMLVKWSSGNWPGLCLLAVLLLLNCHARMPFENMVVAAATTIFGDLVTRYTYIFKMELITVHARALSVFFARGSLRAQVINASRPKNAQ